MGTFLLRGRGNHGECVGDALPGGLRSPPLLDPALGPPCGSRDTLTIVLLYDPSVHDPQPQSCCQILKTILYMVNNMKNYHFNHFYLFIYLFIYGCVGSSFLCEGFL